MLLAVGYFAPGRRLSLEGYEVTDAAVSPHGAVSICDGDLGLVEGG
jgi:hypothetical protein